MSQPMKTALLFVIALGLTMPTKGIAQEAKIAVVDVQALTLASDEGKAVSDKLDKRIQVISADMDKTRKDIEAKENDLKTRDRLMTAAAKAQLQRDIDDGKRAFERKNQDYQKELNDLQNELLLPAAERAKQELAAYVSESGITLLVDLSAEKSNIVWANAGNDITLVVLKRVNESYKKSGAAAPATAPAATTPKPAATAPAGTTPRPNTPSAPPVAPKN